MLTRRRFLQSTAAFAPLPSYVLAQSNWPAKPLTYVVPLAAGGATDTLGRILSEQLAIRLGVPVVVENKTGAGGSIGTEAVARAPADGYTLLGGSISTHAINVSLYKNLSYDPVKSFAPLAMIGFNPLVLCVSADSPYETLRDLLTDAEKSPGTLTYGSAGNGTSMHLAMELLCARANIELVHVPYRGSSPALQAILGRQITMVFDTAVVLEPYIKSGKLRALATGSTARLDRLPDVPTVQESGVNDFEVFSWLAVFLRRGADPKIEHRLRTELSSILATQAMRERMAQLGTVPVNMNQDQMTTFIQSEISKWHQVIKIANVYL